MIYKVTMKLISQTLEYITT